MLSSPPRRTKIFISYSHADSDYLQRLQIHLASDVRNKKIELWDDTKITPGAKWQLEINHAIQTAKVAVLLVSADFLASDFIALNELPPLLSAAESEGVIILPVLLKPCRYKDTPLVDFQFANKPLTSLIEMNEAEREETWVRVAEAITEALNTPSFPTFSPSHSSSQLEQTHLVESHHYIAAYDAPGEHYHKALLADASITKLQVLTMSSPLPISNIYIRLQVHEETRQRYPVLSRREETKDLPTLAQQRERLL
jgi:hypothetical protein